MIDCALGDAFGILSCLFWSTVPQYGARVQIYLELLDCVFSGASFLTRVCLSVTLHIVAMWQYYEWYYKIRSNPIKPSLWYSTVAYVPVRVTRGALTAHRYIYAPPPAEPRSTARVLFHCQYLCGTILVTQYSMVWDWRVSRAGPMPFYWPSCSLPFCPLLFSLSLLSFYMSVLSPYLSLATFFSENNNNKKNNNTEYTNRSFI